MASAWMVSEAHHDKEAKTINECEDVALMATMTLSTIQDGQPRASSELDRAMSELEQRFSNLAEMARGLDPGRLLADVTMHDDVNDIAEASMHDDANATAEASMQDDAISIDESPQEHELAWQASDDALDEIIDNAFPMPKAKGKANKRARTKRRPSVE